MALAAPGRVGYQNIEPGPADPVDCVFCDILCGERDGHFVYRDDHHVAFLDRYPIDRGHTLVVPRRHHVLITDMGPAEVGRLYSVVPGIARAVLKATAADAFSVGQNNGAAARQIVPHVHVHIIPRYEHRGTVWTKREIADDADLADLAGRIRASMGAP